MRTIKDNLFNRLLVQAEEADLQGLSKVANSLTEVIESNAELVRKDDAFYTYSSEQFKADLNGKLWSAALRVVDFYDIHSFNADQLQSAIDKIAEGLVAELCVQANINHGIGAYEEPVPGETVEQASIHVTEDDK